MLISTTLDTTLLWANKNKRTKPSAKFMFTTIPPKLGTTDANTPTAKKWIVIGKKRKYGFTVFFN